MDEKLGQEAPKMSSVESESEEFEMSHTDKIVGVFSEPGKTFERMSKFPVKITDWIIPVLILIVVMILSSVVSISNPGIKRDMVDKTMSKMEKRFDEAVKKNQIPQDQANQKLEEIREGLEHSGILGLVLRSPFIVFISFFFMTTIYLLLAKAILKGDGAYKEVMAAYGLAYYIYMIQIIATVIVSFVTTKFLMDFSIADYLNTDKMTIAGFIFSKINVFSFWFYAVLGVGLAKMFKSANTLKYVIGVFSTWIVTSLLFWLLVQAVPFLGILAGW